MQARFDQDEWEIHLRSRIRQGQETHLPLKLSGKTLSARSSRRGSGPHVSAPAKGTSAAVVKVQYMPAGRTAGYAAYMTKDKEQAVEGVAKYMESHGGPEGKAHLFTREGQTVDLDAFIRDSRHDPRAWTFIIAPEHGNRLDMQAYTQRYMEQVEQDLGHRLDFVAAVHTNTEHHHSHVLIRGKDLDGEAFRIDRDYISNGLRHRAAELQQRWLDLGLTHEPQQIREHTQEHTQTAFQRLQQWVGQHAKERDLDRGMSW